MITEFETISDQLQTIVEADKAIFNGFNGYNIDELWHMFENEANYKKHMNNLFRTRRGLLSIIQAKPEFEKTFKPQFDTMNMLISALLPAHPSIYPFPMYHDIDIEGNPLCQ